MEFLVPNNSLINSHSGISIHHNSSSLENLPARTLPGFDL
jgi:hypothetical protein